MRPLFLVTFEVKMDITFKNPAISTFFSANPGDTLPVEEFQEAVVKPLASNNFISVIHQKLEEVRKKDEAGEVGPAAKRSIGTWGQELSDAYAGYIMATADGGYPQDQVDGYAITCLYNLRKLYLMAQGLTQ